MAAMRLLGRPVETLSEHDCRRPPGAPEAARGDPRVSDPALEDRRSESQRGPEGPADASDAKVEAEVDAAADQAEADAQQRQMRLFAAEVAVLGRCDHPNVVRLLAACLTPPRMCLVMELCETSLERLLYGGEGESRTRLPLGQVLRIAVQVCQGLEYLHPAIVHRDLKPANVLINGANTEAPVAKLAVRILAGRGARQNLMS
ncbi:hypothetical protein GPECTOR_51g740 [Gonium pectorale]|uniref:Protein kinase domain-containing protein n=1 Tax=Gonium pectorale TaxID=33097 RepID=A0A150G7D7_GONPE|nr:hypothetical protein GPECTOR_51g740 [Gonium pectorale]|eukprot:KXZ45754.1 hypothetical protein GPECTOR_51g740 [Gonium pectorale]